MNHFQIGLYKTAVIQEGFPEIASEEVDSIQIQFTVSTLYKKHVLKRPDSLAHFLDDIVLRQLQ
jgi:hypothetical protein